MLQNPPLPHGVMVPHRCRTARRAPHRPEVRPHRQQAGGVALHVDPCVTCLPMTAPPNGGNCTIRGATRRRHAEGRFLMLQNPHHYPWCHAPSPVQDRPTGADKHRWEVAGNDKGTTGGQLPGDACGR